MGIFSSVFALLLVTATGNAASASQEIPPQDKSVVSYATELNRQAAPYKGSENRSEMASTAATDEPTISPRGGFATKPISSFSWSFNGVNINVPVGCFLNMRVDGKGLWLAGTFTAVECVGVAAIVPAMFCNWKGVYRFVDSNGQRICSPDHCHKEWLRASFLPHSRREP